MDKITYGTVEVDFDALPDTSKAAIVSRGVTHFLGNEQASKLAAWVKGDTQANSDDRDVCKAWKEANAEAVTAKEAALVGEAVAALLAGTVGVRVSGPRVTPLDSKRRSLARVEVLGILAGAGVKAPKKDEQVKLGENTFTMDQLIQRRLDHADHGPRITKEAEKAIAAEAKKLEGLKAGAETAIADL